MRSRLFILLLAIAAVIGFAGPASADATSDQAWRDLAYQQLDFANQQISSLPVASVGTPGQPSTMTFDDQLGIPALSYSYQTLIEAEKDGWDFQNPTVVADMNRVLGLYDSGNRYGHSGFVSGQASRTDDMLTVTQASHVGPLMLKAAQYDPADYGIWVNRLVDSIMEESSQNVTTTIDGYTQQTPCVNYDDTGFLCAVNVAVGASDFLQKAWDMGYTGTGTLSYTTMNIQDRIDAGITIAEYAFALGTPHWFPYSLNADGSIASANNACGQKKVKTPQDWNHEGYTIDSVMDLGINDLGANASTALGALQWHLNHHNYNSGDFNAPYGGNDPCRTDLEGAADIQGKLRMMDLDPHTNPSNMMIDVQWMLDTWGTQVDKDGIPYHNADRALQTGLFALQLADAGSDAASLDDTLVDNIDTPELRCTYDGTCPGTGTNANAGSNVTIDSFVRDSFNVGIVDKSVHLERADGAVLQTKSTGLRGNISFVWAAPDKVGQTRCLLVVSDNGTKSPQFCITTK